MHLALREIVLWTLMKGSSRPPQDDPLVLGASIALGVASAALASLAAYQRKRRLYVRREGLKQIELDFADQPEVKETIGLILSSSPAGSSNVSSTATFPDVEALADLRRQVEQLRQRADRRRNEVFEVRRVDPALETTLKLSLENLTTRVELIERKTLTRWDVALTAFQLLGGLGLIAATARYLTASGTH